VLAALQAKLNVGDPMVLKAGTGLCGGVAWQGETCGALTGALMAIGCAIGRERLEDVEQFRQTKGPAQEMIHRFRERVGHSLCAEIHKLRFGRSFRLYDPEDLKAFHAAGAHSRTGCPDVCGIAARTAAEIILRLRAAA
jgi:C_GCAxxG_C_C family probable redox protein